MSRCVEFGGLWIDFLKIKFEKNLATISCKIFPRGVTVVEILVLPGDSQRSKYSPVGVAEGGSSQ